MSRIGKLPVKIPSGVTVTLTDGSVRVQGPKGTLERGLPQFVTVAVEDDEVRVSPSFSRKDEEKKAKSMYGLTRSLIDGMVQGVVEPFKRSLEISGVGYRAELKGQTLNIQVGLSHDVNHPIPPEVSCQVDKLTTIHLTSPDKELVGRVAAEIRAYRPCEPYKGKGIKYVGERIRRKEGKTGA